MCSICGKSANGCKCSSDAGHYLCPLCEGDCTVSEPDVIVVVHEPDPAVLRDDMAETWAEIIDEACEPEAAEG